MDIYLTEHYAKNCEPRVCTDVILTDSVLGALGRRIRRERADPNDAAVLLPFFAECRERGLWPVADGAHYAVKLRGQTYFLSSFSRTRTFLNLVEPREACYRIRRGALNLHRALGTKVSFSDSSGGTRVSRNYSTKVDRGAKLGAILLRALMAAGCGVIHPRESEDSQRAALERELRKHKLCEEETSEELIRVVRTRADRIAVFNAIRDAAGAWASGGRPYGLVVFEVSRIEERKLVVRLGKEHAKWKLKNKLFRFGEERTAGPFLAIATLTVGRGGEDELGYTYLHPLWRKDSFVCVDSDGERRVADFLERFVQTSWGRNLEITKLHGGYRVPNTWPDFEVRRGIRTLVVEVLGFDAAHYLEKKEQQRMLLQASGISVAQVRMFGRTPHTAISALADSLQALCEV